MDNGNNFSKLIKPGLSSCTINKLKPLTKYRARIAVQNSMFTGYFSEWIEFSTFQYILPSKPTIITSFYCRETIRHIEHKIDLIMQSKDNNITYAFNVCIRPLYEMVDMNVYCERIKQHSPEDIEEYQPGHLNKIEVLVTELDAEIWMSAVAINGSMSIESDIKKTIKKKNEWEEICKTNTFTSTTMLTTSTTTITTKMSNNNNNNNINDNLLQIDLQRAELKENELMESDENINSNPIPNITMFDLMENKRTSTRLTDNDETDKKQIPLLYILLIGLLVILIGMVSFLTYYYRHNIFRRKTTLKHLKSNNASNTLPNDYIIRQKQTTVQNSDSTTNEVVQDIYLEILPHENEADISNRLLATVNDDTISPYIQS